MEIQGVLQDGTSKEMRQSWAESDAGQGQHGGLAMASQTLDSERKQQIGTKRADPNMLITDRAACLPVFTSS